jgi:hypothetical protein
MKRSKEPLTAAITSYLWPYLKTIGFVKVTPRKFAREKNDIVQQLWVDANGFGGRENTLFILCSNLIFDKVGGYFDPCGFRICDEKSWDMSTHEKADSAMQEVVEALKTTEFDKLEQVSTVESFLNALEGFWRTEWYQECNELARHWLAKDEKLIEQANFNRGELKL